MKRVHRADSAAWHTLISFSICRSCESLDKFRAAPNAASRQLIALNDHLKADTVAEIDRQGLTIGQAAAALKLGGTRQNTVQSFACRSIIYAAHTRQGHAADLSGSLQGICQLFLALHGSAIEADTLEEAQDAIHLCSDHGAVHALYSPDSRSLRCGIADHSALCGKRRFIHKSADGVHSGPQQ